MQIGMSLSIFVCILATHLSMSAGQEYGLKVDGIEVEGLTATMRNKDETSNSIVVTGNISKLELSSKTESIIEGTVPVEIKRIETGIIGLLATWTTITKISAIDYDDNYTTRCEIVYARNQGLLDTIISFLFGPKKAT